MQEYRVFPPTPASADLPPTFNVVTLYEDFETGTQAKRTYNNLVEQLGKDCQCSSQMWKFDVLSIPELQEIAIMDAVNADLLIIASRGGRELPLQVQEWMEASIKRGCQAIAFVGLFSCDLEHSYFIRTYLAGVAARGGIEFFAQSGEWPDKGATLQRSAAPESEYPLVETARGGRDPGGRWCLKF